MNRNITSKRVIKQKITCFFVLCSFLFSQIFYVNVAYAGMPVIDATSLGFNTGNVTINKILEGIAGVAAGAISSLLTKFAKDAGERVVKGLADGDWGNEPLFFDLPFEDYLTSALDNVAGNFLDDINKEYMINLCKPEDISSINWKFKIMLNIKPDLASFETKYEKGPVCKLSDFISATKKTLSNVITSLKESLVGDCFDEFFYNDICPSVSSSVNSDILAVDTTRTALGGIADNVFSSISNSGGSGFSLNGIKDAFGYNGSVNFCKLGTYYIKKDAVLNLKNITSQILAPNSCNYPSKVAEPLESAIWTSNKADCLEYDEYKKPIFSVGNGKINDGGCMYSINYCKFSGDEVILDRVKRSRFVSQYNNCFNPKLAEYLGSMIEVNSALPKEKMIKNQIQKNCKDSLEIISSYSDLKSIFDTALYSTDKDFHVYVAKLLDGFLDKEGDNSTASTLNGSITFKNNELISARTGNINNLENRKNILISSFIPVEKVETAESCVEKLNLGVNTLFSAESGKHFLYCPVGNGSISDPVLYYKKGSDFKDLILAKSTNINQLNQDGRINKSSSSENAIIEYCTLLNINRYPFMKIEEDLYNKKNS